MHRTLILAILVLPVGCGREDGESIRQQLLAENPPPSAAPVSGASSLQEMYDFYRATDEAGTPALENGPFRSEVGRWKAPGWYRLNVRVRNTLDGSGAAVLELAHRPEVSVGVAIPCDDAKPMPYTGTCRAEMCAQLVTALDGSPGWIIAGVRVYWEEGPQFFNLEPTY